MGEIKLTRIDKCGVSVERCSIDTVITTLKSINKAVDIEVIIKSPGS